MQGFWCDPQTKVLRGDCGRDDEEKCCGVAFGRGLYSRGRDVLRAVFPAQRRRSRRRGRGRGRGSRGKRGGR
eukprot:6188725-Pleurochrysis_carterae.AAC.2